MSIMTKDEAAAIIQQRKQADQALLDELLPDIRSKLKAQMTKHLDDVSPKFDVEYSLSKENENKYLRVLKKAMHEISCEFQEDGWGVVKGDLALCANDARRTEGKILFQINLPLDLQEPQ
jgi:transposase